MNEITTVSVDLAKEVIVVCAADAQGRPIYFKQFSFSGFAEWAANLPPCLIAMEACSSAHHWARYLSERGHTARLIAAELVAPFRMSRGAKNDRNDAQAILCAALQPSMRFVTVKSIDQQAILAWHSARSGYLQERKRLLNRTRGMLAEFGVWLGRSTAAVVRQLPRLAQDDALPALFRPILQHTLAQLRQLDERSACRPSSVSDLSPPARSLPRSPTPATSATGGRCPRGPASCPASTAPVAKLASAPSPNAATPTCEGF